MKFHYDYIITCVLVVVIVPLLFYTITLILYYVRGNAMLEKEMILKDEEREAKERDFYPRPLSIYLDNTGLVFKANPKSFWIDADSRGVVVVSFRVDPKANVQLNGKAIKLEEVSSKTSSDIAIAYSKEVKNIIPGDKLRAKLIEMGAL